MPSLNDALDAFSRDGLVKISGAFDLGPGSIARRWRDDVLRRLDGLGAGLRSPAPTRMVRLRELCPPIWELTSQLLGGAEEVEDVWWSDALVANVGPNPNQELAWHIDGDFFRHFIDSPEQALLTVVLWTDVAAENGPTLVVRDSVAPIARYLLDHPEGVMQMELPYPAIVRTSRDVVPLCGKAGDVFIGHPFLVHSASPGTTASVRLISNPVCRRRHRFRLFPEGDCRVSRYTLMSLGLEHVEVESRSDAEWVRPPRFAEWQNGST